MQCRIHEQVTRRIRHDMGVTACCVSGNQAANPLMVHIPRPFHLRIRAKGKAEDNES
jgi:hypothetical protein